jgi:hypothetical protein
MENKENTPPTSPIKEGEGGQGADHSAFFLPLSFALSQPRSLMFGVNTNRLGVFVYHASCMAITIANA